jgi:hypothetical protein
MSSAALFRWLFVGLLLLLPVSASAQKITYRRLDAQAGARVQVNFHATVSKSCAPAPAPTVRVLSIPRSGSVTVRSAEATIRSLAGCQPFRTPAQAVFYQSQPAFTGEDKLRYEVTSSNGDVTTYEVVITVHAAAKPAHKSNQDRI